MNTVGETDQLALDLHAYIPVSAAKRVAQLLIDHNVQLIIAQPRKTKLGDFRPNTHKPYQRISVNGDLNKHAFLAVLLHELAHLLVWIKYGNGVKPHGQEWQSYHRRLLKDYSNAFPKKMFEVLQKHAEKSTSATLNNPEVIRYVLHPDGQKEIVFLKDLKLNDAFRFQSKSYQILKKNRTRYVCMQLETRKKYLISGAALVDRINTFEH